MLPTQLNKILEIIAIYELDLLESMNSPIWIGNNETRRKFGFPILL